MSPAPAENLKALLRDAKAALGAGEFDGLDAPAAALAALVESAPDEAIGATPERLADLVERLRRALDEARRAVVTTEAETRRRLAALIQETWPMQAEAEPALASALRRERREAVAALAVSRDQARLGPLVRARTALEARAEAAAALDPDRLRRRATALRRMEQTRGAILALLLEPDLGPQERADLEAEIEAPGDAAEDAVARRLDAVRRAIDGRRARARARLDEALVAGRDAGLGASELAPSADRALEAARGAARFLAGAARLETQASWRRFQAIEPRLLAAIADGRRRLAALEKGPRREFLMAAIEDVKIRAAGESLEAIGEALETLQAMLAELGPARAAAPDAPAPTLAPQDLQAIARRDPAAAKVCEELVAWGKARGADDAADLLEQAAREARDVTS